MNRPSFISLPDWNLLKNKYNEKKLSKIVEKIKNGYPVQYLIGYVQFIDSKINVNKHVLIPRFETELLVDNLKKFIKKYDMERSNILDLCTGSGCIAIQLKKNFMESKVYAVDKSLLALKTAFKNAKINNTTIKFMHNDILENVNFKNKFSILVSNPPYVKLDEEVSIETKYEPKMALYPGENDILFYKRILDISKDILYPKNIIAFEIGSTQAERVCNYAKKIFPKAVISVLKDYNDYDRFVFIFNNCE